MMLRMLTAGLLLAGTACVASTQSGGHQGHHEIELKTPAGQVVARATVHPASGGLAVSVRAQGLAPGHYAAHLHAAGRCEGPDFTTAGPHWNPTTRQHGTQNPQGHHLGDLPNLDVGADGSGRVDFTISGAALTGAQGLLDADGAALVIHAGPDDYRTDPSGNSGARIACGVVTAG